MSKLLDVEGLLDEREPLQRGVYQFVTTWYERLKLEYEGVNLGECLQYNLSQLCNHRVLAEMEKARAKPL